MSLLLEMQHYTKVLHITCHKDEGAIQCPYDERLLLLKVLCNSPARCAMCAPPLSPIAVDMLVFYASSECSGAGGQVHLPMTLVRSLMASALKMISWMSLWWNLTWV